MVYANYARVEDFFALEDLGISVQDKIVIARYGKIYRGDKVRVLYNLNKKYPTCLYSIFKLVIRWYPLVITYRNAGTTVRIVRASSIVADYAVQAQIWWSIIISGSFQNGNVFLYPMRNED